MVNKVKDRTGEVYGRWTALKSVGKKGRYVAWLCRCECGTERVVDGYQLSRGSSNSCGCLREEKLREAITTHGKSKHHLYRVWLDMKSRCYNSNTGNYQWYGARGIEVCARWKDSFQKFFDDMGSSYKEGLQLDRIDSDGDYCKKNCRWSTPAENSRNRHATKLDEETVRIIRLSLRNGMKRAEIARVCNVSPKTIDSVRRRETWKDVI